MRLFLVFVLAFIGREFASAQNHDVLYCGQTQARERLFQEYPEAESCSHQATIELENKLLMDETMRGGGSDTTVYIIPVVFHIIHDNGPENISDEQIFDAIKVLNRDFRKQNADTAAIVSEFIGIAADVRIEFRLATKDPQGNCHPGIVRIQDALTYDGGNSAMKDLSFWPRNKYMNVWICAAIGGNVAGFTQMPPDVNSPWSASTDGIVLLHNYTGSIGTSNTLTSRTLTHETGHWLNLFHTWGPTNSPGDAQNCDFDDNVDDTPNTIGYTSCNLAGASCGSDLDNVQNYMEYSYCSKMFTEGQRARMRSALTSNVAQRSSLITQSNLIATGALNPPLCTVTFQVESSSVCSGDTVYFTDHSYHGITSWSWDFGDGTILSGNDPSIHKNPIHIYQDPGVYSVSLSISNGNENLSLTQTSLMTVYGPGQFASPFEEGFENTWPNSNWSQYNQNADETWEITPTAFYSGTKSIKIRNFNNTIPDNLDVLYSATYDMTGATAIYLSYKWAYANKVNETDDRLKVSVTGDCGYNWDLRKMRKGSTNLPTGDPTNNQFTPSSTQWGSEILTLLNQQWFTDRFRVKFEFIGKGGNNFFLDDINITADITQGVTEVKPQFVFALYPNPTADASTLDIIQLNAQHVNITLYNATGQVCKILWNGDLSQGKHSFTINDLASGLYTIVMEKDGARTTQKLVVE
jgi:PKD repeat protein